MAYGWKETTLPDGRVIRHLSAPTFAEVKTGINEMRDQLKSVLLNK